MGEPSAMPKVVVSCSYTNSSSFSCTFYFFILSIYFLFVMTHCQVQMSWWKTTETTETTETMSTPLGFMFPRSSWYRSVIRPKTLPVLYRLLSTDIILKIFHVVVTLVTSYGKPKKSMNVLEELANTLHMTLRQCFRILLDH